LQAAGQFHPGQLRCPGGRPGSLAFGFAGGSKSDHRRLIGRINADPEALGPTGI
jgi:hypothetical protein